MKWKRKDRNRSEGRAERRGWPALELGGHASPFLGPPVGSNFPTPVFFSPRGPTREWYPPRQKCGPVKLEGAREPTRQHDGRATPALRSPAAEKAESERPARPERTHDTHQSRRTPPKMEADDLSGRELTIDSIMNKVRDIKNKFKNEDLTDELSLNKVSADTTDNSGTVNQIIMMANNPEDWLNLLLKLEKNSVPLSDALLNKLIGRYSQAIEALPPDKYGQNENFARIQIRFAELKAIQEPDDARDYFQMARANCKKFAFVHVSFAQFELSQGNFKKSKQLLHKAVEYGAVPLEMLEIAIQNLNLQKKQLLSEEEKKSLSVLNAHEPVASSRGHFQNRSSSCDSRGQSTKARFLCGENLPPHDAEMCHRNPLKQTNNTKRSCPFGRVPVNLLSSPDYHGKTDGSVVSSFTKRQTSGSELCRDMIVPRSKSSGNDSSELRNLKSVQNIHSKEPLMSDEKSSEFTTDSVTLKNKTESSLLIKLEDFSNLINK
ncbi:hypothetical protein MC885_002067 [Smutsia gigantea]|nr:hypothetical protein MC885_002067 [Smutsia gigantea]